MTSVAKFPGDYVLSADGFFFDPAVGEVDQSYSYSDGEGIERGIYEILRGSDDLSSLSSELQSKIIDWPTSYYLSPRRANLLRPIESLLKGRVLEVGAGCGALTRYLGEIAADVVAVEGSAMRARAAAERVRDLDNVQIVRSLLQDFISDKPFDAVVCVGVLEYARAYLPSQCPERTMIDLMKSFLRPGGILIVAIENQLGLKYFSGSLEDHYSKAYFGLNDSYRKDSVTTFGRHELSQIIYDAGFSSIELLAPLPDYKLPVSVVRADLGPDAPDVINRLLEQSVSADQQNAAHSTFSLERAWSVVSRNGLVGDLANSFLILASDERRLSNNTLAWHYSVDRHPAYAKETTFAFVDEGIQVDYRPLSSRSPPTLPLSWRPEVSRYALGTNWWAECVRILNTEGWGVPDLAAWADVWLRSLAEHLGVEYGPNLFRQHVDGLVFDMIPQNMVVHEGVSSFFDFEWSVDVAMPFGVVAVRGLRDSIAKVTSCAYTESGAPLGVNELVLAILSHLGWIVSRVEFDSMAEFDLRVQSWVLGNESGSIDFGALARDWQRALAVRSPADRDLLSYNLQALRAEYEEHKRLAEEASRQGEEAASAALEALRVQSVGALADARRQAAHEHDALRKEYEDQKRAADQASRQAAEVADAALEALKVQSADALADARRQAAQEHDALRKEYGDQKQTADQASRHAGEIADAALEALKAQSAGALANAKQQAAEELNALLEAHQRFELESRASLEGIAQRAVAQTEALGVALEVRLQLERALEVKEREADRDRERLIRDQQSAAASYEARIAEIKGAASLEQSRLVYEQRIVEAEFELKLAKLEREALVDRERLEREREEDRTQFATLLRIERYKSEACRDIVKTVQYQTRGLRAAEARARNAEVLLEKNTSVWRAVSADFWGARVQAQSQRPAPVFKLEHRISDARSVNSSWQEKNWDVLSKRLSKLALSGGRLLTLERWLRGFPKSPRAEARRNVELITEAGIVSSEWYRAAYPEVPDDVMSIVRHYLSTGANEGRGPHPLFDPVWYQGSDDKGAVDPLVHYLKRGWRAGRSPHALFDAAWYAARNPDVAAAGVNSLTHYIRDGAEEGRNPHPLFDSTWYVQQNSVGLPEALDPLTHYVAGGRRSLGSPHPLFNALWYASRNPDIEGVEISPLEHYVTFGWREGRSPHPLFDPAWYLRHSPDVAEANVDPLLHYVEHGWREGRAPHPLFDVAFYLEHSPHASAEDGGPLMHYLRGGWREGRSPHPLFDVSWYMYQEPGIVGSGYEDPLSHYVALGEGRGLTANPLIDEARVNQSVEGVGIGGALLKFIEIENDQNSFTWNKTSRWSREIYLSSQGVLADAARILNGKE